MAEQPRNGEMDWNTASWSDFEKRQEQLRNEFRSPTPFLSADNYPDATEKKNLLISAGFEAELSNALGGVSILIENEEALIKLQEFLTEKNFKLKMTELQSIKF